MKRIKNFLKRNIKYVIAFILGTLVSIFGVYATSTLYDGDVVSYDSTNSGLKIGGVAVDNVQDAIDALYEKSLVCREPAYQIACPGEGCYYFWNTSYYYYTTWNTLSQTPTTIDPNNLPSGVSTNYNDVVTFNMFLAMKLNSNNQVEHAYACGIEGGTPFCIEGYSDDRYQSTNMEIITPIFGASNCGNDYCFGSLVVRSYSNEVNLSYGANRVCAVDSGRLACVNGNGSSH